ncbi:MAG: polysulfide reductase NrfD [Deltaproteobacteria bacterium]|nr:polysulfide reductase NrfD [Deltaproteobacteria bacterium]
MAVPSEISHSLESRVDYRLVDKLVLNTLKPPTVNWYILFVVILACLAVGVSCWTYQILNGIGSSGKSNPVNWGVYITTFVFWVGIAHSGTLISAVLYLFRAKFRMPIYRIAEAMTVFAVITAGLFPIIHLGRPWTFYWLLPYPNQMQLWPNFRSPLLWDVFAVSTYLTISSVFFFVGLLPDIATARDKAETKFRKFLYSVASLGWRGDAERWKHYTSAYLLFAAFATPLVVSVHSVVSWDFAVSVIPGWHATIFPPYFVAGAIFSGVAMVLTLLIPLRKAYNLEPLIRAEHFDAMSKLIIVTSCIVGYAYITEFYVAWWSNNKFERFQFYFRPTGELAVNFWIMFVCNVVFPQFLWIKRLRTHIPFLFILSIIINIGMWFERYNIILQSLYRDYIPSSWGHYNFSWVELGILLGSFGWFGMWMLLFIKFFPSVAITEIKEILPPPVRDPKNLKH